MFTKKWKLDLFRKTETVSEGAFRRSVLCPICRENVAFECPNDYASGRDALRTAQCPHRLCLTRERGLMHVVRSLWNDADLTKVDVHEIAPTGAGLSRELSRACENYLGSGYFPDQPFGSMVGPLRNENAEAQTLEDASFDLVVHLDVLEHLFDPFAALAECVRTLRPGGYCVFTAPTYEDRSTSEQVAFLEADGSVRIEGEPEYHGNPQSKDGSLVTWRYGYDLPVCIFRRTGLETEVRRFHMPGSGVFGPMTEVYLIRKPG
jgi:SAM-dependent methyltransferase